MLFFLFTFPLFSVKACELLNQMPLLEKSSSLLSRLCLNHTQEIGRLSACAEIVKSVQQNLISDKNVIHLWCLDTWAEEWKPFWHIKQIKSNSSILFELSDYGINLNYKSLWVLIKAVPTLVTIALHHARAWLLLLPFSPLVNLHIINVVPCLSSLTYVPVKCGRWWYALSCWANSQYKGRTGAIN